MVKFEILSKPRLCAKRQGQDFQLKSFIISQFRLKISKIYHADTAFSIDDIFDCGIWNYINHIKN